MTPTLFVHLRPGEPYHQALQLELQAVMQRFNITRFASLMIKTRPDPDALTRLMHDLHPLLNTEAEKTVLLTPHHNTPHWINHSTSLGINRFSLEIITFHPERRADLKKKSGHSINLTLQHLASRSLNYDVELSYGLPGESSIQALKHLLNFTPPHLTWSPFLPPEGCDLSPPEARALARTERQGQQLLQSAGYLPYALDLFAQPGFESTHLTRLWRFEDEIGLGLSAHTKAGPPTHLTCYTNTPQLQRYLQHPTKKQRLALTSSELLSAFLLQRLRLFTPLSLSEIITHTGCAEEIIEARLKLVKAQGWMQCTPQGWQLTRRGIHQQDALALFFLKKGG